MSPTKTAKKHRLPQIEGLSRAFWNWNFGFVSRLVLRISNFQDAITMHIPLDRTPQIAQRPYVSRVFRSGAAYPSSAAGRW
jgi:hypothetical protein